MERQDKQHKTEMKERSNKEKETAEGHTRHDNNVVLSNFLPVETLLLCYCRCDLQEASC